MVTILRIGHRIKRDKRITTHLALVARAFGAARLIIAGDEDIKLIKSIQKVNLEWGGNFQLKMIPYDEWKTYVEEWGNDENHKIVHLTMYGENLSNFEQLEAFNKIEKHLENLLIIVGGKKIPGKIFQYADWNIAISNQPHSEVSSLAVFLDHINSNALQINYPNALKQIIPSLEGKKGYIGNQHNGD
ncbi:MAG: tRNA (cytidine(56)-2'-O)-methyltransferase [Promethearchaeota archaeon]